MASDDDFDFGDGTAEQPASPMKRRMQIGAGVVALVAVVFVTASFAPKSENKPRRQAEQVIAIAAPPPPAPPPPPPPPPPPEQEEQEMIKQDDVQEEPEQEDPGDDQPVAAAAGPGNGPNFGLKNKAGTRKASIGGNRLSVWDKYALALQKGLAMSLRSNSGINRKTLTVQVKIWADRTGRVTKAALSKSTGDAALDRTIRDSVFLGLQLPEAPPADMVMPINLEIKASRPE
jgi:periplasmic protein TonB